MRVTWIVLDGVGVGALPDADRYGDAGADTLGNLSRAIGGLRLRHLERLGLGNVHPIAGVPPRAEALACYGRMAERSPGKDSTTGHWELSGVLLDRPFPTYPNGFPAEILERLEAAIGRGVLGNEAASGTEIIARLGSAHVATGRPIVYTSADSVLQIAAHEAVIPLGELYRFCALAREKVMVGEHAVARIIARPFHGENGRYARTPDRKDFSLPPPDGTLLDRLADAMIPVFAVGKIGELFAGRGITESLKTRSNREGIEATLSLMKRPADGLVFVNLVDFDTAYGHRLDPAGFARALEEFDEAVDELIGRTRHDDMLVITADHGNDPTVRSTDHSREHVPLLVCWPRGRRGVDLGVRATFADLGATLADVFRVRPTPAGESFLHAIR